MPQFSVQFLHARTLHGGVQAKSSVVCFVVSRLFEVPLAGSGFACAAQRGFFHRRKPASLTKPGTLASKLAGLGTACLACAGGVMQYENRMKKYLLLLFFSAHVFAQDVAVKTSLADLIEYGVKESGVKINVIPDLMTPTSLNINKVNGLDVCDTEAKKHVISLQSALLKHKNAHSILSVYGAYLRTNESDFKYLPEGSPELVKLLGKCRNLYVSVE